MYPFAILRFNQDYIMQDMFRNTARGGETDSAYIDSKDASTGGSIRLSRTKSNVFYCSTELAAQGLLDYLVRQNPGDTFVMFEAKAAGSSKCLGYSEPEISKFGKAGKLP